MFLFMYWTWKFEIEGVTFSSGSSSESISNLYDQCHRLMPYTTGPVNRNWMTILDSGSISNLVLKPKAARNNTLNVVHNNLRAVIGIELFPGNARLMVLPPSHTSTISEHKNPMHFIWGWFNVKTFKSKNLVQIVFAFCSLSPGSWHLQVLATLYN